MAATTTLIQASSFHSSAAQFKSNLVKKSSVMSVKAKGGQSRKSQSARLKKKARVRPKLPPIGERKAQRHRIVLSNVNAIPLSDMETWSKGNMLEDKNVGQVLGLEPELLDQLRASKAFKTTQNWNLFRKPATLIRSQTVKIAQEMEAVNNAGDAKTLRHLMTGDRASGKSVLLLQAMCMAYMNKWVVINVPEAQDFVNNTSSYAPVRQKQDAAPGSEQLYLQPHLTQALLSRAATSNEAVLKTLKLNHPLPKGVALKKNATLYELAKAGADDHHHAWAVWQAFWKELNEAGANPRPAVLLAADGVDHWMGPTMYRNSEHKFIHAHQFSLVRQFINLLFPSQTSASTSFVNGGMILFSTSGSNDPAHPTFKLLQQQMRARERGVALDSPEFPLPVPYSKADERVLNLLPGSKEVNILNVNGLSVAESKGYLQYFARSGLLLAKITDSLVGEYRTLSAGGVVGELAKLGRRSFA